MYKLWLLSFYVQYVQSVSKTNQGRKIKKKGTRISFGTIHIVCVNIFLEEVQNVMRTFSKIIILFI